MQLKYFRITASAPLVWTNESKQWLKRVLGKDTAVKATTRNAAYRVGGESASIDEWLLNPASIKDSWAALPAQLPPSVFLKLAFSRPADQDSGIGFLQLTVESKPSAAAAQPDSISLASVGLLVDQIQESLSSLGFLQKADNQHSMFPPRGLFFYLQPEQLPEDPNEYLQGKPLAWLKRCSRDFLLTDDPLCSQLSGGFIEGNLLMIRANPDLSKGRPDTRHILVPCLSRYEQQEELIADVLFITNRWSVEEYQASSKILNDDFLALSSQSELYLGYLTSAVKGVRTQMDTIRKMAGERRGASAASEATVQLLGLLHRLSHELFLRTQTAMDLGEDLAFRLNNVDDEFRKIFAIRDLQGLRPLDDALEHLPGSEGLRGQIQSLKKGARNVRAAFAAYKDSLSSVRALHRSEEQVRSDNQQRFLGYALAALAVVSAVPLIIGEITPETLSSSLGTLPSPLNSVALFSQKIHAWFSLFGFSGALALIFGLSGFLIFSGWRNRRVRYNSTADAGRILAEFRRLHSSDLSENELQEADLACARSLIIGLEKGRKTLAGGSGSLDRFILRAEVGCRRPIPFRLPVTAAYMRFGFDDIVGRWLGEDEFNQILVERGLTASANKPLADAAQNSPQQLLETAQSLFYPEKI